MAQWKQIRETMRLLVRSLASLSGLRIPCCRERWCRSKIWLRCGIAVAVAQASSYSSDQTPSLENPICCRYGPKKPKKKKKKNPKNEKTKISLKVSRNIGLIQMTLQMRIQSPASLSGLRIRCCCEQWCRLQTWLGSGVAVAVAVAGGINGVL